jgi:hypothetical protein
MLPDLQKDADGELAIALQSTSPGADLQANWLPARDVSRLIVWGMRRATTGRRGAHRRIDATVTTFLRSRWRQQASGDDRRLLD